MQEGSAPNEPKKVSEISAKCAHSIRSLTPLQRKAMCATPIEPGQVEVLDGDTIRVAGETFRPTPAEALQKLRCELARSLLQTTPLKLAQIADKTGFGSESRLRRSLKRQFGVGARDLRERF